MSAPTTTREAAMSMPTGCAQLLACLQGNRDAYDFFVALREVSHTWDDLIDQDKPVSQRDIHRAFWLCLVGIPEIPFYQQHRTLLQPVLESGIFNFVASVEMERTPGHPRELAHTARYAAGDVTLIMARIIGGLDWAMEHAAILKQLMHVDTLDNFNREMDARYGQTPNPTPA